MPSLNEQLLSILSHSLTRANQFADPRVLRELENTKAIVKGISAKFNAKKLSSSQIDTIKSQLIGAIGASKIDSFSCHNIMNLLSEDKALVLAIFALLRDKKMAVVTSYTTVIKHIYTTPSESNYREVLKLYAQVKKDFPADKLDAYFYKALMRVAMNNNQLEDAEAFFNASLTERNANDYSLYEAYLQALMQLNQFDKADAILATIMSKFHGKRPLEQLSYLVVEHALKFKNYQFAKRFFSHEFTAQDINTIELNKYMHFACESNDFKEAVRICKMLLTMDLTNGYSVSMLISGAIDAVDYMSAKELFMLAFYKNKLSASAYSSFMTIAGKLGYGDEVETAYRWACDKGIANLITHTAYISACGRCGRLDRALTVFKKLQATHQDDRKAYSALIGAASTNCAWELAKKYYELAIEKHGLGQSSNQETRTEQVILLTTFLTATTNKKQYLVAKQKYAQAKMRGINDRTLTNVMVDIAAKVGELEESRGFFREEVAPDQCTYTSYIDGLGKANQYGLAKRYFDEAIHKQLITTKPAPGREVSCRPLTMMIHLAGINNQYADAKCYYDLLIDANAANSYSFCTLIDVAGKAGEFSDAQNAYSLALERNFKSSHLFNAYIDAASKCNRMNEMQQAFERAVEEGYVNTITYSIIIKTLVHAGDSAQATKLYMEALNKGMFNATTCQIMVGAAKNNDKFNVFRHGFDQAMKKGRANTFFCNDFVAFAKEQQQLSVIVIHYSEIMAQKLTDIECLSALITESGKHGRFDKTEQFYNAATAQDNDNTEPHYAFIKVACAFHQFEEADKAIQSLLPIENDLSKGIELLANTRPYWLLKKMYRYLLLTQTLTSKICLKMMNAVLQETQWNDAEQSAEVKLLEEDAIQNHLIDRDIYLVLIQSALKQGNTDLAAQYWRRASKLLVSPEQDIASQEQYILLLGNNGRIDVAKERFYKLYSDKLVRSETYTLLITLASQNNQLALAEKAYKLCVAQKNATVETYNAILLAYLNDENNHYAKAVDIHAAAKKHRQTNATTYITMMRIAAKQPLPPQETTVHQETALLEPVQVEVAQPLVSQESQWEQFVHQQTIQYTVMPQFVVIHQNPNEINFWNYYLLQQYTFTQYVQRQYQYQMYLFQQQMMKQYQDQQSIVADVPAETVTNEANDEITLEQFQQQQALFRTQRQAQLILKDINNWFNNALDKEYSDQRVVDAFVDLICEFCQQYKMNWEILTIVISLFKDRVYEQTLFANIMLGIAEHHHFEATRWMFRQMFSRSSRIETGCCIALIQAANSKIDLLQVATILEDAFTTDQVDTEAYTCFIAACYQYKLPVNIAASAMRKTIQNARATELSCQTYFQYALAENHQRLDDEREVILTASSANLISSDNYEQLITLIERNGHTEDLITLFNDVIINGRMTSSLFDKMIDVYLKQNQVETAKGLFLDAHLRFHASIQAYSRLVEFCSDRDLFFTLQPIFERALTDHLVDEPMCGRYIALALKHEQLEAIKKVFDLAPNCITAQNIYEYSRLACQRQQFEAAKTALILACYLKIADSTLCNFLLSCDGLSDKESEDIFRATSICFMESALSLGQETQASDYLAKVMPHMDTHQAYDFRNWSYKLTTLALEWLVKNMRHGDYDIILADRKKQSADNSPTLDGISTFCKRHGIRIKLESDRGHSSSHNSASSNKRTYSDNSRGSLFHSSNPPPRESTSFNKKQKTTAHAERANYYGPG